MTGAPLTPSVVRTQMMRFEDWLKQVRETGWIEPLRFGMTCEALIDELGELERVGQGWRKAKRPKILAYGSVESHFGQNSDDGLCLIYSDDECGIVKLCIKQDGVSYCARSPPRGCSLRLADLTKFRPRLRELESGNRLASGRVRCAHGVRHGGYGVNQAAPRTPLESPWTLRSRRVATRSENTQRPQCFGTLS